MKHGGAASNSEWPFCAKEMTALGSAGAASTTSSHALGQAMVAHQLRLLQLHGGLERGVSQRCPARARAASVPARSRSSSQA
eukprot:7375756-Pyramimonas_sp.AAC.1